MKTYKRKKQKQAPIAIIKNSFLKTDTVRFVSGAILMGFALLLLLSFTSYLFTGALDQASIEAGSVDASANICGRLGAHMAYYFMNDCFGIGAYLIPIFLLAAGLKLMKAYKIRLWKWFVHLAFLMIWISITIATLSVTMPDSTISTFPFLPGGRHGDIATHWLNREIGMVGTWMVLLLAVLTYLVVLSGETMSIIRKLLRPQEFIKRYPITSKQDTQIISPSDETEAHNEPTMETPTPTIIDLGQPDEIKTSPTLMLSEDTERTPDTHEASELTVEIEQSAEEEKAKPQTKEHIGIDIPYDPRKDLENYHFPPLSLLKDYGDSTPAIDMAEQNANKENIVTVLRNFGIEITSIKATIGPTVTLYEIVQVEGVRINKIKNLENDIAQKLRAIGIRIIAPIPGRGTVGIEVPNRNPRIVSMESLLNSRKFQETNFELPMALGKTITNDIFMVDLAKLPHLLVAGATGQGKSVGLNAIVTSLLYKKHPSELKFVIVDPKKVEFSIYAPIEKQFLAKIPGEEEAIITDVTKAAQTLKSLCFLMDQRYDMLKKARTRNIKEYNAKFRRRELNPENGHSFMPYIVVIIDEFSDLIMQAGKEVEIPVIRIAQLARAVGIHMIIATQRPTINIITGTIKTNFPARMAFKVSQGVDSKTILDRTGAEHLIGKGDMLFLGPTCGGDLVRVQCAFIDTPEVERINDFISRQQSYAYAYELPEPPSDTDSEGNGSAMAMDAGQLDSMFEDAARLVVIHQSGSTSLIQRKFSIGYNRAGRLMDQLEKAGIVGPAQGSKPRDVLCNDEIELEQRLEALKNHSQNF